MSSTLFPAHMLPSTEIPSSHGAGSSLRASTICNFSISPMTSESSARHRDFPNAIISSLRLFCQRTYRVRLKRAIPAPSCASSSQADDSSEENQNESEPGNVPPRPTPSPQGSDGPQSPELNSLLSQLSGLSSPNSRSSDPPSSPAESPKSPKLYSHLDQLPKHPPPAQPRAAPPTPPATSTPPAAALTVADKDAILASLATLAESLSRLSASLEAASSTVGLLATAIQDSGEPAAAERHHNGDQAGAADLIQEKVRQVEANIPTPWEGTAAATSDPTQKLVFQIQRAFVQSRITGLGKPPEVAMSDFIDACMAAREGGIDLSQLQLKLILLEGALPPQFTLGSQTGQANPFIAEEGRIRAIWIRFVYVALDLVESEKNGGALKALSGSLEEKAGDPMDEFVKKGEHMSIRGVGGPVQTLELAMNEGRTYEMVRAEHANEGLASSQAIQMMRQSQSIVLMTLKKATSL